MLFLILLYTSREPLGQYYTDYTRPQSDTSNLGHPPWAGDEHSTEGAAEASEEQKWAEGFYSTTLPLPDHLHTTVTSASSATPTPSGPPIPDDIPLDHSKPRQRLTEQLQQILTWDPPASIAPEDHDPPYDGFYDSDYDPNRWEGFEQNTDMFTKGTVRKQVSDLIPPMPYRPYPAYNSPDWKAQWRGEYVPCVGFRGLPYNETDEEVVKAYQLKPGQFPEPDAGSFEAVGLDPHVCFDRDSRLGLAGLGKRDGAWSMNLNIGQLQNQCLERNKDRYELNHPPHLRPGRDIKEFRSGSNEGFNAAHKQSGPQYHARTAVLVRTWEYYVYEENDILAIRSLVSELALQSGGEYQVFLFVNIKDEEAHIFEDPTLYEEKLHAVVPPEFRDMSILWSERLSGYLYPQVDEYRVGIAQYMPVQWFMATHPEFEYVWNWEMDARHIGQTYQFVEQMAKFAKKQPRKHLVERNTRFYFPSAHGTYEEFFNETNRQIRESDFVGSIWGPDLDLTDFVLGPQPPTSEAEDNYEWGVGEEADFISLLPIWDPLWTSWGWRHTIYGYEDPFVTRRAYINTHARFSRRLLHAMHEENTRGRNMMAEMWPTTVAMHHGLKAVYAPQPVWFSHRWPSEYKEWVFNSEGWGAASFYNESDPDELGVNQGVMHVEKGRGVAYNETLARMQLPQVGVGPNGEGAKARWTQERDSVYNMDREHNFKGWSWYYHSDFGKMIYWRWLGWHSTYTETTIGWAEDWDAMPDVGTSEWEDEHGRLCFPSMLLHPVKNVKPPEDEKPPPPDSNVPNEPYLRQGEKEEKGEDEDGGLGEA